MLSLSRHEIYQLRDRGYQLDGDNWVKAPMPAQTTAGGLRIAKVCNADTLAVVFIPEDILAPATSTF